MFALEPENLHIPCAAFSLSFFQQMSIIQREGVNMYKVLCTFLLPREYPDQKFCTLFYELRAVKWDYL